MANDKDISFFVSWCIETYKSLHNLSGEKVLQLFDRYDVLQYLIDHFEVLHTQSPQWLMEEIDQIIESRNNA